MRADRVNPAPLWRDQPAGLWVLAGTELWDRISFYGMQALLMLYMAEWLLRPGHADGVLGLGRLRGAIEAITGTLTVDALAAQIMGLYVSLVFLMPIFGGMLGDRVIGRRAAVTAGAVAMTCGHLALAADSTFLIGLVLIVCGVGLLRGNISAQLKALYGRGDQREHAGFQIYYAALNIGAFVAPLITGLLARQVGWHAGFAFAGIGMTIGLLVYLRGSARLPPDAPTQASGDDEAADASGRAVLALLAIWPLLICYWFAQSQVWNVYNLWVRDHVALSVWRFEVPIPWLQALDGLAPILLLPICMAWWRRQAERGRERDQLDRMITGSWLLAASMAWLAAAPSIAAGGRVPLLWPVGFHAISSLAGLYFIPATLALFAGSGARRFRATMIGVSMSAGFVASLVSGRIGGLYGALSPAAFWALHAAIAAVPGLVLTFAAGRCRAMLLPDRAAMVTDDALVTPRVAAGG